MSALLHIGSGDDALIDQLRESGVEVLTSAAGTTPGERFDVAVIAPDVAAPLQVARRIRAEAPEAYIVFLTTPATDAALRRELMVGRIGTQWSLAPAGDAETTADVVHRAIADTERRRKLRTTLGRVNLQLAQPPAAARRTVISDHFLALVLDQLSDAVVALDPAGNVLAWNGAAARAFGEIRRGAPFVEALPEAAGQAIREACERPDGHAESLLVAPQHGTEYSLRATALRGTAGEVIGVAVVARDVTAARSEERQRQIIADAVRALGSTLDVREGLQHLCDLLAHEVSDIAVADIAEGNEVHRYAVAGRTPQLRTLLERTRGVNMGRNRQHPSVAAIMRGETVVHNRLTDSDLVSIASGEEHLAVLREMQPHAYLTVPLRSGDQTVGAIMIARLEPRDFSPDDIRTMEHLARQTATALHNIWAYHAAAEASRLKDEFLATLSHELRTPMTSILGWAQILRLEDANGEMLRDGLESIERSARAQAQLIDDLLDLSRMQMGKVQFQPRPFSLTAVVRAAVDTVRPTAQARNIELITDAPDDVVIQGDPDRMQQVIWNLLSNAVKFSEPQTEVRVSLTTDGVCAHVAVADRGRGIAPDFLPHVFDRFRQADAATTRRYGGLGLGLTIVKQLVEMHGGTVTADSRGVGHGATFTVSLPLPAPRQKSEVPPPPAVPRDPMRLPDLHGICVLLVEDDVPSARMLSTMLERAGADVRTAHSAAAALESLRERIPDVLISDVAMPNEDGLSLIRAVRGRLRIPAERLPAVALTAFHDVDLRVAVLGAGFQRFMTKPVEAQTLASVVETLAKR